MLLLVTAGRAATLTVATDGTGTHTTIAAAVTAAAEGDTILVAAGEWREDVVLSGRRLILRSLEGAERTTLVGSGRATLDLTGSTVTVAGFTVENASGRGLLVDGSTVALSDSVLASFQGATDGAAAHVASGSLVVSDTTFSGNLGVNGGAVSVATGELEVDGCTFTDNEAGYGGGAIHAAAYTTVRVTDSTFSGNTNGASELYQAGGAIYIGSYADLEVEGSTFEGNGSASYAAQITYGGAIYLGTGTTGVVTDSTFDGNLAYYGGAFFQDYYGSLAYTGGVATSNYGVYGGVGYARYIDQLALTDVEVLDSAAYYYGAGFYVEGAGRIALHGTTFDEGYATYGYGGALMLYYIGDLDVADTVFSDNLAYQSGGAIYLYSATQARFSGVEATDNVATYGTGGAVIAYYVADLEIIDSAFRRNAAAGYSGAIYAVYGGFSVSGSTFERNEAQANSGGAIYASAHGYDVAVADTRFSGNVAAGDGGGLAVDGGALSVVDSAFVGGQAGVSGGGLYSAGASSRVVRRVVASGNVARYGGGVYVSGAASPDAWASWVLTDNEASYGGGAVFVETAATSLVNGVLLSNAATELGAGLYAYDGSFDLRNAAVAWNLGAAAVYAESADITAAYDAWWENPDGNTHGFAPTDAVLAAPGFVDYGGDGDATDDTFALWRSSALIDAGDPALSDADGSRSDIGVRGGAWFVPEDADGDGASTATDCDDADPATLPGAPDAWYDGADTNCDGASDYDQDGDGLDAQPYGGPDCDDTDAAVGPCPGEDTATPDDTGVPDTNTASDADTDGADTATPKDDAEGCGCATRSAAPNPAWAGLVALGALVRRRVHGVRGISRA